MKNLRIHEALISHNSKNKEEKTLIDLAKKIWPDSKHLTQQVNISELARGKRTTVKTEWVKIICEETGVSPDFLFGFSNGKFDW